MPPDKRDPSYAKYIRGTSEVERALRETCGLDGPKGANPAYSRGYTFSFEWTQEQRDVVNKLMEYGMSFDEAFDYYVALPADQK